MNDKPIVEQFIEAFERRLLEQQQQIGALIRERDELTAKLASLTINDELRQLIIDKSANGSSIVDPIVAYRNATGSSLLVARRVVQSVLSKVR